MNSIAARFGAPVTVTAQAWVRNASSASRSGRRMPSTWSTVWISREAISICRRPITSTVPGTQTRALSLRSTSVHMVSSDSSLVEESRVRIWWASAIGFSPRSMVPDTGVVSTRYRPSGRGSTRTNISGDAPTRYSWVPRLARNPNGAGLRFDSRRNTSTGLDSQASENVWLGTTSNRSPRAKYCRAAVTSSAYSPGAWSRSAAGVWPPTYGSVGTWRGSPAVLAASTVKS